MIQKNKPPLQLKKLLLSLLIFSLLVLGYAIFTAKNSENLMTILTYIGVFIIVFFLFQALEKPLSSFLKKQPKLALFLFLFIPLFSVALFFMFQNSENIYIRKGIKFTAFIIVVFSVFILNWIISIKSSDKKKLIDERISNFSNFGEVLSNPILWKNFLADNRSKQYFDERGKILPENKFPNNQLTKTEIAASLMHELNQNKLFKEEYTIVEQMKISDKFFGVSASIAKSDKRNPKLFSWIVELM